MQILFSFSQQLFEAIAASLSEVCGHLCKEFTTQEKQKGQNWKLLQCTLLFFKIKSLLFIFFIMFKWQTISLRCFQVLPSPQMISMLHLEKKSHQFMYVAQKCLLTHDDSCLKRCTGDCAPSGKNNMRHQQDHKMCQKLNEEVLKGKTSISWL